MISKVFVCVVWGVFVTYHIPHTTSLLWGRRGCCASSRLAVTGRTGRRTTRATRRTKFARILRRKQKTGGKGSLNEYAISDNLDGIRYNEIKLVRDGNTFKMRFLERIDESNICKKVRDAYASSRAVRS